MSGEQENAWARALATKYGITQPIAPETPSERFQELFAAEYDRVLMMGGTPATTPMAS